MLTKTIVYSLSANREMAEEVAKTLNSDLYHADIRHFLDGEIIASPSATVRGKNVFAIQSTSPPVTERLMELLIFVDALKRASAREITVVLPYFGYARQDRKARAREPITARLIANLLQTAGIHRIVTLDLHSPQLQGFFDCPADDLSAIPLIGKYIKKQKDFNKENLIVVAPDHGGTTRARKLATVLNVPIAIIDKRRPKPNVAEIMNVIGDVKGKTCIMIDDIIDTGGTIIAGAKALKENGAQAVYAACTHGLFSNNALQKLQDSCLTKVITTNTITHNIGPEFTKIEVLSIAPMLAKAIDHIEKGIPLSLVYDEFGIF